MKQNPIPTAARTATRVVLALIGGGAVLAMPFAVAVIISDNASHEDMFDGLAAGLATMALVACGVVLLLVVASWRLVSRDRPLGYVLATLPGLLLLFVAASAGVELPESPGRTLGFLVAGLLVVGAPVTALVFRR